MRDGARSDVVRRLAALAEAACLHARERHGMTLTVAGDHVDIIDRILAREVVAPSGGPVAIAACYGAWIGEVAVRELRARWIGLDEPVAPRLLIGSTIVSPIDAMERLLARVADAPAPSSILARLRVWAGQWNQHQGDEALVRNRAAWSALIGDPRFTATGPWPDRAHAIAALDPWLREDGVVGKDVLCLAAGGGRHGPLLAAAGARVTVVDLSEDQLALDRRAAAAGLAVTTVLAPLDDLSALPDAAFALAVQPVSACYVPDLTKAHAELARVLRTGALYVVQHKQPASLQCDGPAMLSYIDGLSLPSVPAGSSHREAGAAEFLHTLDALLGGLCRAGFVIEDVVEPLLADALAPTGSAGHRALTLPPYLKVKARRR